MWGVGWVKGCGWLGGVVGLGFERERTGFLGEVLDRGSGVATGFWEERVVVRGVRYGVLSMS